jgi:hypothetical protein
VFVEQGALPGREGFAPGDHRVHLSCARGEAHGIDLASLREGRFDADVFEESPHRGIDLCRENRREKQHDEYG